MESSRNQQVDPDQFEVELARRETHPTSQAHSRRAARWVDGYLSAQRFAQEQGRTPRAHAELHSLESRVFEWIRRQRRAPRLTDFQIQCMNSLPGFEWEPRQVHWNEMLLAVSDYIAREGHEPRASADVPEERTLARWLARQKQALRRGRLAHNRVISLRTLLTEVSLDEQTRHVSGSNGVVPEQSDPLL